MKCSCQLVINLSLTHSGCQCQMQAGTNVSFRNLYLLLIIRKSTENLNFGYHPDIKSFSFLCKNLKFNI